eukprot:423878-Prymnesium_polylepis.2
MRWSRGVCVSYLGARWESYASDDARLAASYAHWPMRDGDGRCVLRVHSAVKLKGTAHVHVHVWSMDSLATAKRGHLLLLTLCL